jgi:hypothetical protein
LSWELFFLFAAGGAVVGLTARYLSQDQRTKRALRRVPRTTVRNAVEGQALKIVGRVRFLGQPLEAPLSGTPCAHYRVTVVQQQGRSPEIIREEQGSDFLLEDATGRARVHMAGARIAVNMDNGSRSGTFTDANERQEALLARHGKSSHGWIFNKSLTYSEGILQEGEEVAVFGKARWESDPDPGANGFSGGYREQPLRLVIEHSEAGPVLVSDHPSVLE